MQNLKVGITGLGLIGGSILKRLSDKGFYTVAVSKSSCDKAKKWASECSCDLSILKNADVVFVCSEMSKTLEVLDELEKILNPETVVADVCSLKEFVCGKERTYKFIGTHPMAGVEFSGFESSFPELFEDAKWVMSEHNEVLEHLIIQAGAEPVIMDPKTHDEAAAMVSHLPMLMAQGLFGAAEKHKNALILASSGFRDATRLAAANPTLSNDMIEMNLQNIENALREVLEQMEYLKKLPYGERIRALEKNAQDRAKMYDKQGKNTL